MLQSRFDPVDVTCNEKGDAVVRICVEIPGVKKKFGKNDIENGSIDIKYDTQSLDLKVHVTREDSGKTKFAVYSYAIKRLPDEIIMEKCHHKVKEDQIVLYLQKATIRSWAADLDRTGPETDRPDEN